MSTKSIKGIKLAIEALMAEVKEKGKEYLLADFREFFEQNPEVTGIAWTQYAPHFNDGDACIFNVHEFNFTTCDNPKAAFSDFQGYGEGEPSEGFSMGTWREEKKTSTQKAVDQFEAEVSDNEVFRTIFGESVKILATPMGFKVEEHYHD